MVGAFGLAGWHFSSNPTKSSSESKVSYAPGSEPWKTGSDAKYQYHPGGDTSKGRKDAPSALNEVVIPNVNLPKVRHTVQVSENELEKGRKNTMRTCFANVSLQSLHEKYNKWGKEGY
jgi:hypothetical protein